MLRHNINFKKALTKKKKKKKRDKIVLDKVARLVKDLQQNKSKSLNSLK